jgi:hypothetical protein
VNTTTQVKHDVALPAVIVALWVSGVGALDRASFIALKAASRPSKAPSSRR